MSALPASAAGAALPASAPRPRPAIWIVYGVMGVLLAAYFVRELSGANHYSSLVDGWMVAGFELVASGLCLARGLVRRPGRAVALVLGVRAAVLVGGGRGDHHRGSRRGDTLGALAR